MSTVKVTNIQNASASAPNLVTDTLGNVSTPGTIVMSSSYIRNRLINGAMQVDQRNAGASQTITAAAALAYTVDRWYAYCTGANVTGQRVSGTAPSQYNYRFTGAASVTAVGFGQRIEQSNSFDLAGTTATLSVNLASSSITTVTWTAYYATTTADTFGSLASPTVTSIATGTFTITSTLTNYSANITIPAAATTGLQILFTTGALTASNTLTIGAAQLEPGSVATPFERRPINEVLAQCQRYFYSATNGYGGAYANAAGNFRTGTLVFPTQMRTVPTLATTNVYLSGSASSLNIDQQNVNGIGYYLAAAAANYLFTNFSYTANAEL